MVNGLIINSAGHIYASTGFPDGITVSKDNGLSFSYQNSGLPAFPMGHLEKDSEEYIYAFIDAPPHCIYRTTDPTVGEKEILLQPVGTRHQLQVSPNPVSGTLWGRVNDDVPDGTYSYTITDVTGRKVASNRLVLSQKRFSIDVSLLSAGYYMLYVQYDDCIYTAKVIKH
ncbi:MAG: hypothetical protein A2X11_06480 [Bacteroidetes bacterium GWE2_42_24]|nr:MAG: hypothetical protein A2X11_06480 [Bacteroidetes bacterium GWE2_42_24]OFY25659.1 MAG: hypothetical protein A2X09_01705 [Bacteroidetes bacterium GWF2_43_11]